MKIAVEIKPLAEMRYPTVGDYYYENEVLKIDIAETGNPFYNYMVLIHELIELSLLEKRGVPFQEIDAFDLLFEKEREDNYHDLDEEPGFDPRAPYVREHTLATAVEMLMCAHAGEHWNVYSETIITL